MGFLHDGRPRATLSTCKPVTKTPSALSLSLARPGRTDKRETPPTSGHPIIDALFTGEIDWDLIATHTRDMIQVVLSIQDGQVPFEKTL
jgi:hypothetical protein